MNQCLEVLTVIWQYIRTESRNFFIEYPRQIWNDYKIRCLLRPLYVEKFMREHGDPARFPPELRHESELEHDQFNYTFWYRLKLLLFRISSVLWIYFMVLWDIFELYFPFICGFTLTTLFIWGLYYYV